MARGLYSKVVCGALLVVKMKIVQFVCKLSRRRGGKNIPTLGLSTDALLGYDHAKFQKKNVWETWVFSDRLFSGNYQHLKISNIVFNGAVVRGCATAA
jgi:hypothetical protein